MQDLGLLSFWGYLLNDVVLKSDLAMIATNIRLLLMSRPYLCARTVHDELRTFILRKARQPCWCVGSRSCADASSVFHLAQFNISLRLQSSLLDIQSISFLRPHLPLLPRLPRLHLLRRNPMQHNLIRQLRRILLKPLTPIIAHRIRKDAPRTIERRSADRAPHTRIALESVFCDAIPEVERPVAACGAERAVLRVEGDVVDGVDVADVTGCAGGQIGRAHV